MSNHRNQPLVRQARRWGIALGIVPRCRRGCRDDRLPPPTPTTAMTCWAKLERI